MTVTSLVPIQWYAGDGIDTSFAFPRRVDEAEDIRLFLRTAAGVETELTEGTHYDVTGLGDDGGATITYPRSGSPPPYDVPAPFGTDVVAFHDPVLDQQMQLRSQLPWDPSEQEKKFDDFAYRIQALQEQVDRCVKIDITSQDDPPAAQGLLALPTAAEVPYDNSDSGLAADDVKEALDELDGNLDGLAAEDVSYDNTISGLTADDVKEAIDELDTNVDTNTTAIAAIPAPNPVLISSHTVTPGDAVANITFANSWFNTYHHMEIRVGNYNQTTSLKRAACYPMTGGTATAPATLRYQLIEGANAVNTAQQGTGDWYLGAGGHGNGRSMAWTIIINHRDGNRRQTLTGSGFYWPSGITQRVPVQFTLETAVYSPFDGVQFKPGPFADTSTLSSGIFQLWGWKL